MLPCAETSVIIAGNASAEAALPIKAKIATKAIIFVFAINLNLYLEYINTSFDYIAMVITKIESANND